MKLKDVDDEKFLKEGWEDGEEGEFVQSWVESKEGGWTADQVGLSFFFLFFWRMEW